MNYDYMKTIGEIPLLSKEEELYLAKQILLGDEDAKNKMIISNLKLVIPVAKHYDGVGKLSFEDLVQEGNIGLMRAVEKFDYTKGYKFSTYATWWIRQTISRALADNSRIIRIPAHLTEVVNKVNKTQRELTQELGREATVEDLEKKLNYSKEELIDFINLSKDLISLDKPIDNDEEICLNELVADSRFEEPGAALIKEDKIKAIKEVLSTLSEREEFIITNRFGLNDGHSKTLEEIGDELGLTRERIRQLEEKALRKLNHPMRREVLQEWL